MEAYPNEGALRGGHIPGAANIPWARAANEDGSFKSADELRAIYTGENNLQAGDDIVAYCRIGGAQQPHLVRADLPARLSASQKL